MKVCSSCAKAQTNNCPMYEHRDSEAFGAMITLGITMHVAKTGRCKFWAAQEACDGLAGLADRHGYSEAVRSGNRDLFEV